jgi:hypothetical protein
MLIGSDFEKLHFQFAGLELVEPNAILGNSLIFVLSSYFALKTGRLQESHAYFRYWKYFFTIFGASFLLGGLAHGFYLYFGVYGKAPSWFGGILSTYFLERALLSIFPKKSLQLVFIRWSTWKLVFFLLLQTVVILAVDLTNYPSLGFAISSANSSIGLVLTLGVLSYYYSKTMNAFQYLWISVLVLLPSVFFQVFKINFHPWMDRNDVGHILLLICLPLYFTSIKRYSRQQKEALFTTKND